jgi:RNA polymerase primary sigma factor
MGAVSGVDATIQAFLRKGGCPDSVDAEGRTLIRIAAEKGHSSICRLLLEAGADPRRPDRRGIDALQAASGSGSADTIALIRGFQHVPSPSISPAPAPSLEQCDAQDPTVAQAEEEDRDGTRDPPDLEAVLTDGSWESEQESLLTQIDHPDCLSLSEAVQIRIAGHRIVDSDQDWSDVAVALPALHSRRLARSFLPEETVTWISRMLEVGFEHGWVPPEWLEKAEEGLLLEGDRLDLHARLTMLLGEQGIQIGNGDERVDAPVGDFLTDADDLQEEVQDFLADLEAAWRNPLAAYFKDVWRFPLLTPEEEQLWGRLWQEDRNPEGIHRLVEGNLRFVVREARRYQGLGLRLEDLVSEGNLGLIHAAERFDPGRETRFLTYAAWWIKQSIFHALAEQGGRFRLPQKVAGELFQLGRMIANFHSEKGREPTVSELMALGAFTERQLDRLLAFRSQNQYAANGAGAADWDDIPEDLPSPDPDPMGVFEDAEKEEIVRIALTRLTGREQKVLVLRYGLNGKEPLTLDQIGQISVPSVSRERIRQIEDGALTKVRARMKGILGYLPGMNAHERTFAVPREFPTLEDLDEQL